MKYEQPFGISDTNASYINGNPSTGTMGSIPPAASIENPQREIVNLIADCGFTPTDADLHQLGEAIQSGKLFYADDVGTPNAIAVTLKPPLQAYVKGMVIVSKIGASNGNTGPATLSANGITPQHITHRDGAPLVLGDYIAGSMQAFAYDGTNFQLAWRGSGPNYLFGARDYYVATTGSDTLNDGLSSAKPFATIQHALDVAHTFNQNGYSVTIHVGDGNYTGPILCYAINGQGFITILGNTAQPTNVTVQGVNGSAFRVAGTYNFKGLAASGTSGPGDAGNAFQVGYGALVDIDTCAIGSCASYAIYTGGAANVELSGPIQMYGNCQGLVTATAGGLLLVDSACVLTISPAIAVSGAFANAIDTAIVQMRFASIVGGGLVTGQKFNAFGNAVIDTNGSGINYLPGTVAGVLASGAQYI